MRPRLALVPVTAVTMLALVACDRAGGEAAPRVPTGGAASDPVVARALHDPLMSDPDLALRSEANAILTYADAAPLPVIEATPEAARRARDAARSALLEGGAIPPPTPLAAGPAGRPWGDARETADLLAAAGVPAACRAAAREGFAWAAQLAPHAAIMPHGMVERAAGSDAAGCRLRLVRYLTPASPEDALGWHDTLAQRAGLAIRRHAEPETMLIARGGTAGQLRVRIGSAASGMTAVDLVAWTSP